MKAKKSTIVLVLTLMVFAITSCNNDKMGTPGTIQFNASTQNSGVKSASIETTAGEITLQTAVVEIKNLQIEENSGNDGEGNFDGGNNDGGNDKGGSEIEGEDILLAGPYVLDISEGSASIDQIEAQPGTYKKVNFDFVAGAENESNSIVLSGNYTTADAAVIPFELKSNFEANVQLPLTKGITVSSGSTVSVSIVFDVAGWLHGLDFENATQTDGKIIIDPTQNTSLYNAFINALSKNIEVEE